MTGTGQAAILWCMTATAVKIPFADASPAEIREAILPEDQDAFDRQYREALRVAAETYRLDDLEKTLASWRLNARQVAAEGPKAWRALLAKADRILTTGELPSGTRPWEEVKAELGL